MPEINNPIGGALLYQVREVIMPVHDTTIVDLDGDGLPDILQGVLDSSGLGQWYWWQNLGNGQFADRVVISQGPTSMQLNDVDIRLADMDGDGLIDLVKLTRTWQGTCPDTRSTWNVTWFRNLGRDSSGGLKFGVLPVTVTGLQAHLAEPGVVTTCPGGYGSITSRFISFADMNHDGLPDFVYMSIVGILANDANTAIFSMRYYYYPNQGARGYPGVDGSGYGAQLTASHYSGSGLQISTKISIIGGTATVTTMDHFSIIDMNGDRVPDVAVFANNRYYYYPGRADGSFGDAVDLLGFPPVFLIRANSMGLADMNGDGIPEILQGNPGSYSVFSLNNSDTHQNLETVRNPFGGTLNFYYNFNHGQNINRWVVKQASLSDGLSAASQTNYDFWGGKYVGWPINEFRGYNYATVRDPAGYPAITYFHQDDARKGRVNYSQNWWNPAVGNGLMTQTTNTYVTSTPYAGRNITRADLSAQQVDTYDATASYKTARTDYANYDDYGNARQVTISGADIATRVTNTDFVYTTLVKPKPYHSQTTVGTIKISESWFDYDGQPNGFANIRGDLTRETHWLSGGASPVTQYAYDAYGNRIGTLDAKGNTCATTGYTSKVDYDTTYGTFPVAETNALCQTTSKTYWGVNTSLSATNVTGAYATPGQLATVTDVNSVRSDSYWDSLGHPKASVIPPDNTSFPTTVWSYGVIGAAPSWTFESKRETAGAAGTLDNVTYVDGFNRTIQAKSEAKTAGQWVTQDTWYNSRGLPESVTVPYFSYSLGYSARNTAQYKTTTLYDAVQRPVMVTNPDNTYRTFTYTPYVVATTDEKFNTTTRTYDASKRLISVVEPAGGGTTTYNYDIFGALGNNFQYIYAQGGATTTTAFNTLGLKMRSTDPDLGTWYYTYDANGNPSTQTDAKAQVLTYDYDSLNRIHTKTYPKSGGVITYFYDDLTAGAFRNGRLWKVTDLSGSSTFTYDQRGRQTKVDKAIASTTYTSQYGYDSLDRLTAMFYPNNEYVWLIYNTQGLLDSVKYFPGFYVSNLDYNALGQVTSKTAGNGKVTTYDYYSDSQRLRNLATPGLQNLTYSYDNVGNLSSTVSTVQAGGTQNFGYDALNRLTAASSLVSGTIPGYYHSYTYDAIGNLKSGDGKTFTYPAAQTLHPHAPTSDGTCSYLYDANGNTNTRTCGATVRTFTWDYDNRLSQVKDGNIVLESFTYDYTGTRMSKVENDITVLTPFRKRSTNSSIAHRTPT